MINNIYAVAQVWGKQILVRPNQWYDISFLKNIKIGDFILLNKILILKKNNQIQLGYPYLKKGYLLGTIFQQIKGKKITVLKTKPKKNYTRVRGHRQKYTRIFIKDIKNKFSVLKKIKLFEEITKKIKFFNSKEF